MNRLKIAKLVDFGLYLDAEKEGEILLPYRYMPENPTVGDSLNVFICNDSEDRIIATTETPKVMVDQCAMLKVVAVESVGAFLDWGLSKDLFLPYGEQTRPLNVGEEVVVHVYVDNSQRISASMKLEKFMKEPEGELWEGQKVDLVIVAQTELGFKTSVEGCYWGLLYTNEIFQPVSIGQRTPGYIRKIRDDGKIDVALQQAGYKAADEVAQKVLNLLQQEGGFLAFNDKTPADTIYRVFGVSKKKYKIALGGLYKKRLITIESDGIRLVTSQLLR